MAQLIQAIFVALGSFILPALAGGLLHELTHAAAVLALGHDLKGMNLHRLVVGLRTGSTVVYEQTHESRWNDLIGLSPLLVGLAAAATWWLWGSPLDGPAGVALAIGWAFYTLNISREDAMGGDIEPALKMDKAIEFAFVGGVGGVLQFVAYNPGQMIGQALLLAATVGVAINLAPQLAKSDTAPE